MNWSAPAATQTTGEVGRTVMLPPRPCPKHEARKPAAETVAFGLRKTEADDTGARLRMEQAAATEATPVPPMQQASGSSEPMAFASTMPPPRQNGASISIDETVLFGESYLTGSMGLVGAHEHALRAAPTMPPQAQLSWLSRVTRAMAVVLSVELIFIAVRLLQRADALPL